MPPPVKLLKHSAMKKIRYIALLLSMAIAAAALSASAATKQFTLAFDENDFRFSTNEYGELVIQPADPMSTMPAGGLPALPQFSTVIAVGERQTYKSHEISVSKRLVRSGIVMEPAQFAVPTDSIFAGAKFERVFPDYDLAQYPADNCEYATTSHWAGGVSTLHFLSCPFVYNPEGGELYFIDSMTLTVELDETPAPARAASSSAVRHETPWFVHDMVINPDDMPSGPQRISSSSLSGYVDPNRIDYVIITTNALKQAFEPLANWKKIKGVPSKIITIEEIKTKYGTTDIPLQIKRCLRDLYNNNGLKYALLGGDDEVVPVRGCFGMVVSNKSLIIDKTIPTDLYYACFDGNFEWNYDGNDIYGDYTDRINLSPNIYVSRVPVKTESQVSNYVEKALNYEKNPQFNDSILMCGSQLFSKQYGTQSDAEKACEYLYDESLSKYFPNRTRLFDTCSDVEYATTYNVTANNLQSELSKGYYWVEAMFHGLQFLWALDPEGENKGNIYYYSDANQLTQNGHSIIITSACLTNAFDSSNEGGKFDPCLSEAFIRNKESGVIAYFGCSRNNWGDPESLENWSSLKYEKAFYNRVLSTNYKERTFGAVCAAAKADLITQAVSGESSKDIRWIQFGLNPIGDPEMPIYLSQPKSFDNASIKFKNDSLIIKAGTPFSTICVSSLGDNGASFYKIFSGVSEVVLTSYPLDINICFSNSTLYVPKQLTIRQIQNKVHNKVNTYYGDLIRVGENICPREPQGPVIIEKSRTRFIADKIVICSGVRVEAQGTLILDK